MAVLKPLYLDFFNGAIREFADGDTIDTTPPGVYTKILPYTATGLEGNPFTVTGLDGKLVIGILRAGQYKRINATSASDDETIKVTGDEIEDSGGIVSSGGELTLKSGDSLIAGEKLDIIYYG